jgi:hypothetical protein
VEMGEGASIGLVSIFTLWLGLAGKRGSLRCGADAASDDSAVRSGR